MMELTYKTPTIQPGMLFLIGLRRNHLRFQSDRAGFTEIFPLG